MADRPQVADRREQPGSSRIDVIRPSPSRSVVPPQLDGYTERPVGGECEIDGAEGLPAEIAGERNELVVPLPFGKLILERDFELLHPEGRGRSRIFLDAPRERRDRRTGRFA